MEPIIMKKIKVPAISHTIPKRPTPINKFNNTSLELNAETPPPFEGGVIEQLKSYSSLKFK